MTERSFPIVDEALSADQWQTITLGLGRGIVDRGGNPYWLSNKDSVTNEVTIGIDSIHDYNEAILDGFAHKMDAPKQISVPPVTTTTVYEIGLVYDPNSANPIGPITLEAWVAPGDTSNKVSRLPLWEVTRSANVSLASSPHREIRPRVSPGIAVSRFADLPTAGLVLSDMIALVREEGAFYRSAVSSGSVEWIALGGGSGGELDGATAAPTPNTIAKRGSGGAIGVETGADAKDAVNRETYFANLTWNNVTGKPAKYPATDHQHGAYDIVSGELDNARVKGSTKAYSNTNVGSTWASVVATTSGNFGRYPSALKYKKNVRQWVVSPETVYGMTPVKYEDTQNGDTRVGFVADSYINSLPEMVETNPDTGEVEGWKYMLTCVAQQVAIRDLNQRLKDQWAECERLRDNQSEILAYLGLNTDENGRVITNESGA